MIARNTWGYWCRYCGEFIHFWCKHLGQGGDWR